MLSTLMTLFGWLFFFTASLHAQESPIEKLRRLPPKERETRLIEGAKREGEVMWYGNWERDELDQLARSFKKKYPFINVSIFRGGSGKVEDKVVIEYRAGKYSEADYEEMKKAIENEAALVIAEMEMVTGGIVSPGARQAAAKSRL